MEEQNTTNPSTTPSTPVMFNFSYFKTPSGILKLVEIVFGVICWGLIASAWTCNKSAFQFVMFVTVTSWIMTLISICIFVLGIPSTVGASLPWSIIEFAFNVVWSLFYFIAACVQSAYTCPYYFFPYTSYLVAASVFAFLTTIAYVANAIEASKEWRGAYPWQSGGGTGFTVKT